MAYHVARYETLLYFCVVSSCQLSRYEYLFYPDRYTYSAIILKENQPQVSTSLQCSITTVSLFVILSLRIGYDRPIFKSMVRRAID